MAPVPEYARMLFGFTRTPSLVFASLVFLTACGNSTISRSPTWSPASVSPLTETPAEHAALATEFREIGTAYAIPAGLLESIAYVETRWHPANIDRATAHASGTEEPDGSASDSHRHRLVYGVMGLQADAALGKNLQRAAAALGRSADDLIVDTHANIEGAAALLKKIARERNLSGAGVAEWSEVVRAYSGISDLVDSDGYIEEVYRVLREGVNADGIVIAAPPDLATPAARSTVKATSVDDEWSASAVDAKPPAAFEKSPNYTLNGLPKPKYIVIHVTEGSFAGSVAWLKNTESQASSHYIIRSSDGLIKQLVQEKDKAWHARCWNSQAIGIEHEGFVARPEKYFTDAMYNSSAKLVRYLTEKYAIPRTNVRIVGHNLGDSSLIKQTGLSDCNDHNDPGPGWAWTKYLGLVVNGVTSAPLGLR